MYTSSTLNWELYFLFKNEEVSIFTLKEYAMKTNNTVIAQIVSDIEIQNQER